MVEDLLKDFGLRAKSKGLDIKVDIPKKPVFINGDRLGLKEVLGNLIDNAIIYTPKGYIEVSLEDLGNKVIFYVKDSGAGLSEKDKVQLFTEGGKGEESSKYNVDTSGYGLFIAKRVVEKHGGEIFAESEGRDKGSTFTVFLPKK